MKNHAHTIVANHLASHNHNITIESHWMLDEMLATQLKMLVEQTKQLSTIERYDAAMEIIK